MKKFFVLLLVLLLTITFVACDSGDEQVYEPDGEDIEEQIYEPEPEEIEEEDEETIELLTTEDLQALILERIEEMDQYTYFGFSQGIDTWERNFTRFRLPIDVASEILDIQSEQLLDTDIWAFSMELVDMDGSIIPRHQQSRLSEDSFSHWNFTVEIQDGSDSSSLDVYGRQLIRIYQFYNLDFNAPGITYANFNRITNGMTVEEVNTLLARTGSLSAESGNTRIYTWTQTFAGGRIAVISVTFTNGGVSAKAQVGW